MMSAYNTGWLKNLQIVKECKTWMNADIITKEQFERITSAHPSAFFHPNIIIRILLFIAALIALSGVSGLLALMISDADEDAFPFLTTLYGGVSFIFLDRVFIRRMNHYKSGVTEALIYHSAGFVIAGVCWYLEMSPGISLAFSMIFCGLVAYRYHDLILTAVSIMCFCSFAFYELYEAGDVGQLIIPIAFIIVFSGVYFFIKKIKTLKNSFLWEDCLILAESISLLIVYAAGNYFVVRELSVSMLGLYIEDGQDIPWAFLFYAMTVIIPVAYLYVAIRKRDIVLLRVSLAVLAFSVFTFKYYFSLGHPEITLTLAGAVLIAIALLISGYLRAPRNGFTRDKVLSEKWAESNPEAFVISQTLGGNKIVPDESFHAGGGDFGGGGSSGSF